MANWTPIPLSLVRDVFTLFSAPVAGERSDRPSLRIVGDTEAPARQDRLARYFEAPTTPEPDWPGQWRILKHL